MKNVETPNGEKCKLISKKAVALAVLRACIKTASSLSVPSVPDPWSAPRALAPYFLCFPVFPACIFCLVPVCSLRLDHLALDSWYVTLGPGILLYDPHLWTQCITFIALSPQPPTYGLHLWHWQSHNWDLRNFMLQLKHCVAWQHV